MRPPSGQAHQQAAGQILQQRPAPEVVPRRGELTLNMMRNDMMKGVSVTHSSAL